MRPRQAQFVMLMLFAAACQPAENSDEADVAAIRAMTEAWEAAVQAEDVPALVAMCTDDIVVMGPDVPRARGKQVLEDSYRGLFEAFSVKATWPVEGTEEIVVADEWAYQISEFTVSMTPKTGGEATEDHGKLIMIFQRQPDGAWKFAREVWNRNSPPGGTQQAQ